MKILYLIQDFPYPLTNGNHVKLFNIISYMAKYHECHILSFGDKDLHSRTMEFQQKVPEIRILNQFPLCSGFALFLKRLVYLLCGRPLFLARWNNRTFAKSVRHALKNTDYDLVHLDALGVAPYVHLCQPIPTVISTVDAISLSYRYAAKASRSFIRKIYRFLASKFIARFERKILPLFTKVHVVSKLDQDYLHFHVPEANIECIEHVVPDEVLQYPDNHSYTPSRTKRILFTGLLKRDVVARELSTFLSLVYPLIWKEFPDVEMIVLGGVTPRNLRKQIARTPGVHLLEWVDDYCAEVMKAQVVICLNMSSTGIKTNVLYALALGKPLVASPPALEGIDIQDGVHCFRREVNKRFAECVLSLLKDEGLRQKIGQSARRFIIENYNARLSGSKWNELYMSMVFKRESQKRK